MLPYMCVANENLVDRNDQMETAIKNLHIKDQKYVFWITINMQI